jgi:hypothetical protein
VNPDAPVSVVRAEPCFAGQNPLVLRKRFPKQVKDAVLAAFKEGVVNEDTGLTVGMSGRDFHKHLDTKGSVDELTHMEAIANLPELMRTAKRIESRGDRNTQSDAPLLGLRRFISAFNNGTGDYSVLLTVKEHAPGQYMLDVENPVRLYHHRVEKQLTPAPSTEPGVEANSSSTPSSANSYTIRQLLEGVKDADGKQYFQRRERGARGGILPLDDGRRLVALFKNKDASTPIHETGHFFLENLREEVSVETSPQWVLDSWGKLQREYGFEHGAQGEAWRAAQERFAREFEAYAREGKAPSAELRTVFEKFREWLTAIYADVKRLLGDGELSPEVREVFDSLLRSGEEIRRPPEKYLKRLGAAQ